MLTTQSLSNYIQIQLKSIASKNSNMKERTEIDLTDISLYRLHRTFHDFLTNGWGFTPSPLN